MASKGSEKEATMILFWIHPPLGSLGRSNLRQVPESALQLGPQVAASEKSKVQVPQ